MITGGEVVPQTNTEATVAALLLVIFAVVNNTILTIFAQYAEELQHKAAELQKTIDLTNTAMENLTLSKELRKDVLEYVQNTHNTKERQRDLTDFIKSVSPSYKLKARLQIFKVIGEKNFIFKLLIDEYIIKFSKKDNPLQ